MSKKPQDQTIDEWYSDYDAATPIVAQPKGKYQRKTADVISQKHFADRRFKAMYERGEI